MHQTYSWAPSQHFFPKSNLRAHLRSKCGALRWKQGQPLWPIPVGNLLGLFKQSHNTLITIQHLPYHQYAPEAHILIGQYFCPKSNMRSPFTVEEWWVEVKAMPTIVAHICDPYLWGTCWGYLNSLTTLSPQYNTRNLSLTTATAPTSTLPSISQLGWYHNQVDWAMSGEGWSSFWEQHCLC